MQPRFNIESLRTQYEFIPFSTAIPHTTGLALPEVQALRQIPSFIPILILLHEDNRFFFHQGFHWAEIRRTLKEFLFKRIPLRGGSSVTQQLIKVIYTNMDRSFRRKLLESYLTFKLERTLSKDEIFLLYLHNIKFGEPALLGIEAASQFYFHKPCSQLTVVEVLFLANLIPNPVRRQKAFLEKDNVQKFPFKHAFEKCCDLLIMYYPIVGIELFRDIEDAASSIPLSTFLEKKKWLFYNSGFDGVAPERFLAIQYRSLHYMRRLKRMLIGLHKREEYS